MWAQVRSSADQYLGVPVNEVTLRGFDAAVGNATKTSDSVSCPNQVTQNPTQVPQPDAMAEFVACLTAEQRVKLATLLLGDPA